MQVDEFSDVTKDGMVYERWEVTSVDGRGLRFSLTEVEDRIVLLPTRVPIDLALLNKVAATLVLES